MNDFTIHIYKELLLNLKNKGHSFQTFYNYLQSPEKNAILLRQDVDDRKLHSLQFAEIQNQMGISSTFYFRMVPESFDVEVIRRIYALGHEIGYHYEDMDFANGNPKMAIQSFRKNISILRNIVPINTICMHGSPKSNYDNKDLWRYFDYKEYGIIGEPYFDLDFTKIAYYTDTGRSWNGKKFSVRDKVHSAEKFPVFNSTKDMITAINNEVFPNTAMFNFHPQRWTNNTCLWYKELLWQNSKNWVKYFVINIKS